MCKTEYDAKKKDRTGSRIINHNQKYKRHHTQGIIIHYLIFYYIHTQSWNLITIIFSFTSLIKYSFFVMQESEFDLFHFYIIVKVYFFV